MKVWNWDLGKLAEVDMDSKMIALAASAAAMAIETEDGVVPEELSEIHEGSPFVIPLLIPEGVRSGDNRSVDENALTTRDLPIPLLWQPATGDGHNGSFIVGRIDTIERVEKGLGNARGVFDTGPYGVEAERLVGARMLRGVSADLDEFEATVNGTEMSGENFSDAIETITSEPIDIHKARVMAATLVPKPSFQECTIELATDEPDSEESFDMPDGIYEETPPTGDAAEFAISALAASAAPINPPSAWFTQPELNGPTPLTVTDDGHVFGHIATWETDHIGFNHRVNPPRSRSGYAYFRTGVVRTEEGEDVAVGQLTLAGGHASLDADAHSAVKHYDDTASAVADVTIGEDAFGIWVAGGLRPGVTGEQVRVLRASCPSGDWRPINNTLELVAICQVNVPGFPVSRARVASGSVMSLVAAGAQTLYKLRRSEIEDLGARLNALELQILEQKKKELAAQMAPIREERVNRLREAAAAAREALAPELERKAAAKAELAARAEEARKVFKLNVMPDFKEELHPRDDEGKFRHVLGRLTDLLNGPDVNEPEAEKAKESLQRAADLEDAGDMEGAKAAAGDAAQQIESAAEGAKGAPAGLPDPDRDGDAPGDTDADGDGPVGRAGDRVKAKLGDQLHEIAQDVAAAVGEAAGEAVKEVVKEGAETVGNPNDEVPEEFRELLEHIIDELGEGVDPQTVVSRMDNKLRHWLEGKGFQNPEDLLKIIEKLLQRPVQPGITQ